MIEGADEISVKLNDNREFKGRVIGTDPSTDLALVKIEGDDFPTIPVGDSEALKVGEWVLAVGNPFNLNSTVTCLLYTSDAADEEDSVDLGGCRIIKNKQNMGRPK